MYLLGCSSLTYLGQRKCIRFGSGSNLISFIKQISSNFIWMQIWRIISSKDSTVVQFVNAWVSIWFLANEKSNISLCWEWRKDNQHFWIYLISILRRSLVFWVRGTTASQPLPLLLLLHIEMTTIILTKTDVAQRLI